MRMWLRWLQVMLIVSGVALFTLQAAPQTKQASPPFSPDDFPRTLLPMPLYEGAIPNSIAGPDHEQKTMRGGLTAISNVSLPTATVYLPTKNKASHSAILLFPGGAYEFLSWDLEGVSMAQALQDHGVAAILVKYRMP